MKEEYRKCLECGAIVKVIKDCTCDDCGIQCCGEKMQEVSAEEIKDELN